MSNNTYASLFSRYLKFRGDLISKVDKHVMEMLHDRLKTYPYRLSNDQAKRFVERAVKITLTEKTDDEDYLQKIRKIEATRSAKLASWAKNIM